MTPEDQMLQKRAQMQAMALRGQEPRAQLRDADTFNAIGGALAGLGGRVGAAITQDMSQRGDALRRLAGETQGRREGFSQQKDMQGLQAEQQTGLANLNNKAEMERLLLQLGAKKAADEADKAGKLADTEKDLRNKLLDMPETRDALKVAGYNRAVQGASSTGAGDIGLLYNFLHVVEPGSQVKEGEFAVAGKAGGLRNEVQGYFNKLDGRGQLPPEMRRQLKEESKMLLKSRLGGYKKIQDSFRDLSGKYGVSPENVVIGLGLEDDGPGQGPGGVNLDSIPKPQTKAEYDALPPGSVYMDPKKNVPVTKGGGPVATK